MHQGQLREAYGPSIEFFIESGFSASDVELFALNLDKGLTALRIQAVDKPPYIADYLIDELKLTEVLTESISYHNPQALQRDVDSVSAIMRLRRGQEHFTTEECKALFVTTNNALVSISRRFFYEESPPGAVPPCIPDYVLNNILWLKKPMKAPDLPRKRIIADYYAATHPPERLWKHYLEEIDELKKTGKVTPDDAYLLRHSLEAKYAMMDITLGEEDAFTQGTVMEVLTMVRSKIQQEKDVELKEQMQLREVKEQEVQTLQAKERERLVRIKVRAQAYARNIAQGLKFIGLCALFIGMVSTFPWGFPSLMINLLRYLLFSIQALLLFLSIASLMWGTTLESLIRRIELKLALDFENRLLAILEE
jgi:hypothetical protein